MLMHYWRWHETEGELRINGGRTEMDKGRINKEVKREGERERERERRRGKRK